jgi:4-amino-4-deoxy-L-arabinose transferase-like glycosyltransferase
LLLIAGVGLAGRVVYVVTVAQHVETGLYDSYWYATEAELLADGEWFHGTAGHAPLTALVLAPAALIGDDSEIPMRLTMALLGAAAVIVIGLLARKIAGEPAGIAAAAISAIYPFLWMSDGLIMSETPTILLVAAVLLATYRVLDNPTWGRFVILGVLCGLAALTRAELALLVPLLVVPVAHRTGVTWRDRMLRAGVVAGIAGLVVAPWLVYNLARFDEPTFISTQDGLTLLGGSCDDAFAGPRMGLISLTPECRFENPDVDESVRSRLARTRALHYLEDNRERLPLVATVRVLRTWNLYRPWDMVDLNTAEGRPSWATGAGLFFFYPIAALAGLGGRQLRRRRVPLWPLAAPIVITVGVSAVFWGQTRFRAPAEPVLVVLAGTATAWLVARVAGRDVDRSRSGLELTPSGRGDEQPAPGESDGTAPRGHRPDGRHGDAGEVAAHRPVGSRLTGP